MNRVVVTGLGAITPIGNDVDTFWNGLKEKKLGFGPITAFDTTDYKAKLAAEVKEFDAKQYMDSKAARRMERFSQFAVAAAKMALDDAKINMEEEDPFRVGVSLGSGVGSLQIIEKEHTKLTGHSNINVLYFASYLSIKKIPVWIRHVIVPGITQKKDQLEVLGEFLAKLDNIQALDILPYHTMGAVKYKSLGKQYPLASIPPLTKEQALEARNIIVESIRKHKLKNMNK